MFIPVVAGLFFFSAVTVFAHVLDDVPVSRRVSDSSVAHTEPEVSSSGTSTEATPVSAPSAVDGAGSSEEGNPGQHVNSVAVLNVDNILAADGPIGKHLKVISERAVDSLKRDAGISGLSLVSGDHNAVAHKFVRQVLTEVVKEFAEFHSIPESERESKCPIATAVSDVVVKSQITGDTTLRDAASRLSGGTTPPPVTGGGGLPSRVLGSVVVEDLASCGVSCRSHTRCD